MTTLRAWLCAVLLFAGASASRAAVLPGEKETWRRIEAPSFTLFGNVSASQLAETARRLESLRHVLAKATRGLSAQSPLPTYVYVFKSTASYEPYKLDEAGKPRSIAGYFVATPEGNYATMDASGASTPYEIIFHEYIHYVVSNNFRGLPVWLNEGLAEFYSTVKPSTSDGRKAQVGLAIPEHVQELRSRKLLPLARLFAIDTKSPEYNEADRQSIFYAECWALTHWMATSGDAVGGRLSGLLNRLRSGEELEPAFRAATGMTLEAAEKEIAKYVRETAFTYYTVTFDQAVADLDVEAVAMSRADTLYRLGDLLAHNPPIRYADAEAHLAAALALDPASTGVILTRAELEHSRERWDASAAAFEAALLKGGAKASREYGLMLMDRADEEQGKKRPASDAPVPPQVLKARELFRQALAQSPEDPIALAGVGTTYLYGDEDATEGLKSLMRAYEKMPSRPEYLSAWIALAARSGQVDVAFTALERGLRKAGSAELVRAAEQSIAGAESERALEAVQQGKPEEARAIVAAASSRLKDPVVRSQLAQFGTKLTEAAIGQGAVDRYNAGVKAANERDYAKARELFESVAATAEDAELKAAAEQAAGKMRSAEAELRIHERVNAAVAQANGGDLKGAIRTLEALLAEETDWRSDTRASVETMLGEMKAAQKGKR